MCLVVCVFDCVFEYCIMHVFDRLMMRSCVCLVVCLNV